MMYAVKVKVDAPEPADSTVTITMSGKQARLILGLLGPLGGPEARGILARSTLARPAYSRGTETDSVCSDIYSIWSPLHDALKEAKQL